MSKFDYVKARGVAEKLINKFGADGSFILAGTSEGGYDGFGNAIPPEPDAVFPGEISPLLSYKQMEVDGSRILTTDTYVYFHSDNEPPIDSKITINGDEYRLINIKKLGSVDGVNVYRKMQLRR